MGIPDPEAVLIDGRSSAFNLMYDFWINEFLFFQIMQFAKLSTTIDLVSPSNDNESSLFASDERRHVLFRFLFVLFLDVNTHVAYPIPIDIIIEIATIFAKVTCNGHPAGGISPNLHLELFQCAIPIFSIEFLQLNCGWFNIANSDPSTLTTSLKMHNFPVIDNRRNIFLFREILSLCSLFWKLILNQCI